MQIPAEFLPRSWEMPPGARALDESASVVAREFDGQTLDWLVALVEIPTLEHPITWVRPLDARFDAGFVVLGGHSSTPYVITRRYPSEAPLTLLTTMCKQSRLGRQFFFNEQGTLCNQDETALGSVIFEASGIASWCAGITADDNKVPIPFRWNKPLTDAEFFRLPALKIWNRLQELLDRPNARVVFARQFAFANEKTRQDLVFEIAPLEQKEFNNLMRSLIYSQDFWEEWKEWEVEIEIFVPNGHLPKVDVYLDDEISQTPAELNEKVFSLWWHLQPVKAAIAKYPSIVNWLHQKSQNSKASFSPPTAHEQLEAHIRWRDWLAQTEKL